MTSRVPIVSGEGMRPASSRLACTGQYAQPLTTVVNTEVLRTLPGHGLAIAAESVHRLGGHRSRQRPQRHRLPSTW